MNESSLTAKGFRRNPDGSWSKGAALGGLPAAVRERDDVSKPPRSHADEKSGTGCLVVSITQFRKRLLDSDNLIFGCKWCRDSIAASLGIDDGDKRLIWEYAQQRTDGSEGVIVKIERRDV